MIRESSQRVCEGLALALRTYGVPEQTLTDNGKVFTGRSNRPPVEALFDRICRENDIGHLLTQPRSPTTTGKIERFHRALRTEFRTDRVFASLAVAPAEPAGVTWPPAESEAGAWMGRSGGSTTWVSGGKVDVAPSLVTASAAVQPPDSTARGTRALTFRHVMGFSDTRALLDRCW
jgi:transposase InsO family protein